MTATHNDIISEKSIFKTNRFLNKLACKFVLKLDKSSYVLHRLTLILFV